MLSLLKEMSGQLRHTVTTSCVEFNYFKIASKNCLIFKGRVTAYAQKQSSMLYKFRKDFQ